MDESEYILTVGRVEQHWLPTCGCEACRAERERRTMANRVPSKKHVFRLSVDSAYLLGIISRRPDPAVSMARSLNLRRG